VAAEGEIGTVDERNRQSVEILPPTRALTGTVVVPGSKSITNRALLIAALAKGESKLSGVLASDDTRHMTTALRAMGVEIQAIDDTTVRVRGSGRLAAPSQPLFLGNAGTATRFLTAAAILADGPVVIDGDEHMRKRPIRPLVEALHRLGVEIAAPTGCPPVALKGQGSFPATRVEIDASLSSQYVSALLMASACARQPVDIVLAGAKKIGARGYIDLTAAVMAEFGAVVRPIGETSWRVEPTGYRAADYGVEPDMSSATYIWAAEVLTAGRIKILFDNPATRQPDARARNVIATFPDMPAEIDGSQMQDAVPTLAVMAAFNRHPVRFVGIGNLRVKECDRINALRLGLNAIKPGLASDTEDSLTVYGDPDLTAPQAPVVIDTWNDHRMAMSFALAGLKLRNVVIDNPSCVSKTFPSFWDVLAGLGVEMKWS
jgi:3-phosphoshikimate 1-carboxyvinyltransferase